jgi:hypothetical protein
LFFDRNSEELAANHPDCTEDMSLLHTGLKTIGQLILKAPSVNGNSSTWKELLDKVESERTVLSKHLDGKAIFTAMLRMYAAIYRETHGSLKLEKQHREEFRGQKRRKRIPFKNNHETRPQPYARILRLHIRVRCQPGPSSLL